MDTKLRLLLTSALALSLTVALAGLDARSARACGVKLTIKSKGPSRHKQLRAKAKKKLLAAQERQKNHGKRVRSKGDRTPIAAGPTEKVAREARAGGAGDTKNREPKNVAGRDHREGPSLARNTGPTLAATKAKEPAKEKAPEKVATREPVHKEPVHKEPVHKEPVHEEKEAPVATKVPAIRVEVFFGLGSSELDSDGEAALAEVVQWLKDNPKGRLICAGHTDPVGPAGYNRRLSRNRASSVKRYLVQEAGVSGRRIRVIARGESGLAYPADSPKNRRVLIRKR